MIMLKRECVNGIQVLANTEKRFSTVLTKQSYLM